MYTAYVCQVTRLFIECIVFRVLQAPTVSNRIDKTVKIFENVAFLASHFFKSIYLLQARNISILDIVSTSYSLCQFFIISLNIGQKTGY